MHQDVLDSSFLEHRRHLLDIQDLAGLTVGDHAGVNHVPPFALFLFLLRTEVVCIDNFFRFDGFPAFLVVVIKCRFPILLALFPDLAVVLHLALCWNVTC